MVFSYLPNEILNRTITICEKLFKRLNGRNTLFAIVCWRYDRKRIKECQEVVTQRRAELRVSGLNAVCIDPPSSITIDENQSTQGALASFVLI